MEKSAEVIRQPRVEIVKKKKNLLETAEAKAGLDVQIFTPEQSQKNRGLGALVSRADTRRISLVVTRYLDDEQLGLCVAMHTYMGLLLKVSGPHFDWCEVSHSAEVSELGKRLLLCSNLLNKYLERIFPSGWNDGAVYVQHANITAFLAIFAVAARKIRIVHDVDFIDARSLSKDDVYLLQRAQCLASRWMLRKYSVSVNKMLGSEMRRTKNSINDYILNIEKKLFEAVVFIAKVNILEGHGIFHIDKYEKRVTCNYDAQTYIDFFKAISKCIAILQKTWPNSLIGHLSKLTRSNQGKPQCVMLILLDSSYGLHDWKVRMQALFSDFNSYYSSKFYPLGCSEFFDITKSMSINSAVSVQQIKLLIEKLFITDLSYRRLNLPKRRRSWSKGNH